MGSGIISNQNNYNDSSNNGIIAILHKDRILIRSLLIIVILLNIPYADYILYPFLLFSTYVHEMCHGLMAIVVGGTFIKLELYANGSGLAYSFLPDKRLCRILVSSAGYTGTAVVGGIMLLFRRRIKIARYGTIGMGAFILISIVLWVRDSFTLAILIPMGTLLVICSWGFKQRCKCCCCFLSDVQVSYVYSLISSMTCFNAITRIPTLYSSKEFKIGGEAHQSDATSVSNELLGLIPYYIVATIWLLFAFFMSLIGLLCVFNPRNDDCNAADNNTKENLGNNETHNDDDMYIDEPEISIQLTSRES